LLTEIEAALRNCINQGVYYLLLSNKLVILRSLKREDQVKTIYIKLKREFNNIPVPYRPIIGQTLSSTKASTQGNELTEFRKWSEKHVNDEVGVAHSIKDEARALVIEKKLKEASDKFLEVYDYALKYPHPTYIVLGLNNASWHLRKKDIETSHQILKELAWHCGYWFDDPTILMNYLDTILVIAKRAKNYNLFFSMAEMIFYYYEKMLLIEPDCDKKHNETIKLVRKHYGLFYNKGGRVDEITNSKGIQSLLSERIRIPRKFAKSHGLSNTSLYRIIKGEMKHVKVSTLKKILIALNLPHSFENPKVINHLITLLKEDEYFHDNWKNITHFSAFKLKTLFLKAYISLVNLDSINLSECLSYAEKDKESLKVYITQENERIAFFNFAFQLAFDDERVNPFYKARYKLVNQLFSKMGKMRHITPLMRLYSSVDSTADHEMLNVYFKQYVRYSITPWRFDIEEVMSERFSDPDHKKMIRFCKKTNLNELYAYLCLWHFEGKERERLFNFLVRYAK
jgi:DNA-binding Xre family transcriptional regulator